MDEKDRIKLVYLKRDHTVKDDHYSLFNSANLFEKQIREWKLLKVLKKEEFYNIRDKIILDLGCGIGQTLRDFIKYGARPENLCGIDLLPDRISEAKKISPNIDFRCTNAEDLPFEDESFDIVMQFTVFTSILDSRMKENIAKEMIRVLKQDGIILWYDFFVNNPRNPDVRGIRKKRIKSLFPNCSFDFHKVTLAPPIARVFAKYSLLLCYVLELLPFLCTHYLCVIRKKEFLW